MHVKDITDITAGRVGGRTFIWWKTAEHRYSLEVLLSEDGTPRGAGLISKNPLKADRFSTRSQSVKMDPESKSNAEAVRHLLRVFVEEDLLAKAEEAERVRQEEESRKARERDAASARATLRRFLEGLDKHPERIRPGALKGAAQEDVRDLLAVLSDEGLAALAHAFQVGDA